MTTMTTTATPTKLRSGDWGARIPSASVREGDSITITARSGKTWSARVTKVVWQGNGVTIAATSSTSGDRDGLGGSRTREMYRRRYGWDGVVGSSSYYSSGLYDEES